MRGNLTPTNAAAKIKRSIPASAGEPARQTLAGRTCKVYPRECGGTLPWQAHCHPKNGLSPRVRGNLNDRGCAYEHRRSIPASAGEPEEPEEVQWVEEVYPRECGGTFSTDSRSVNCNGLSPRVRGNPFQDAGYRTARRSIPASAGEPARRASSESGWRVYPRECGGTESSHYIAKQKRGLSPRVRGNLLGCPSGVLAFRSIPASAGEPLCDI